MTPRSATQIITTGYVQNDDGLTAFMRAVSKFSVREQTTCVNSVRCGWVKRAVVRQSLKDTSQLAFKDVNRIVFAPLQKNFGAAPRGQPPLSGNIFGCQSWPNL
jgi:hypothetical protein